MRPQPTAAPKMPLAARRSQPPRVPVDLVAAEEPQYIDWLGRPCYVYLQASLSCLVCATEIRTLLPAQYPCLSVTSMGVTLLLEIPPSVPRPVVPQQGGRLCDVAIFSAHLGHPRFAALRQAVRAEPVVRQLSTYAAYFKPLAQAAQGGMTAEEARQLVVRIVDHILQMAGCEGVRMDERVEAAIRYSDEKQSFRIGDIAATLGISASRLSHLFSQHVGLSFRQYTVWCRTMQSWDHVVFSRGKTLTEIAHEMEFSDLAHFSRAFKLVFGVTPSALRERENLHLIGRLAVRGRRAVSGDEWPV